MALFISALNSGSNGNCYYIGNGNEAILIDAGISCGETEKRLKRLGIPVSGIKAIFVSHEHSDHILGIPVLARKYQIPVFITSGTYKEARLHLGKKLVHSFQALQSISLGDLRITPFTKYHDAADPHSFIVSGGDVTVGIFTDIGKACEQVIAHFSQCHAAFLETNYDEDRLLKGKYPIYLKNRIRSDTGHLSNLQALELFINHRSAFMSHLFPSHLSRENNTPELVETLFTNHAGNTKIVMTSRYAETPIYEILNKMPWPLHKPPVHHPPRQGQLTLF